LNPVLTISALNTENSLKSNALATSSDLTDEVFQGEFSELLSDLVSADGKLKPLDLAALKDLAMQELADLQALTKTELNAEAPELKQLSVLNLLAEAPETQIENVELFGNPEIKASLNQNLFNDGLSEEGLSLTKGLDKADLLKANTIAANAQQQSLAGKDTDLSQVLDDVNLSQLVKDMSKSDIDFSSELLTQAGRQAMTQDANTTKMVDSLASMDKSVNPLNQINTQSLKSYSGLEQTTKVMNRIEVPVNQAGWGEAVGNRLMMMVNGRVQSANIHLNPAELGPIEIKVSVNQDHATVHFVSNNSTVRDAIEDAFPRLKEMFSQNGLNLADANVSQQSSQQSSQQTEHLHDEQNDSLISSDDEMQEHSETLNTNANSVDIGLINQYV
jgi:flagellar hook-length control protein FliK